MENRLAYAGLDTGVCAHNVEHPVFFILLPPLLFSGLVQETTTGWLAGRLGLSGQPAIHHKELT